MANYTINNIPNVADDVENSDILPIWKSDEEKTAQVPVSKFMAGTKVTFASSTTVTGNTLASGDVLRIMFTSALTGSDTTTGLTITYNGTPYAVKVCKQGALADFVATEIDSSYYYLQAYTTLELAFNGGAFVIIGNPVVLSSDDYTIYADGKKEYQFPNYDNSTTINANSWTATEDCFINYSFVGTTPPTFQIDGIDMVMDTGASWGSAFCFHSYIKSGTTIYKSSGKLQVFPLYT